MIENVLKRIIVIMYKWLIIDPKINEQLSTSKWMKKAVVTRTDISYYSVVTNGRSHRNSTMKLIRCTLLTREIL